MIGGQTNSTHEGKLILCNLANLLVTQQVNVESFNVPKQVSFYASHCTFLRWGFFATKVKMLVYSTWTMTRYQHFQKRKTLSRFDQQITLVSSSMGSLAFYPALNSKQKNFNERIFCKLLKKIKTFHKKFLQKLWFNQFKQQIIARFDFACSRCLPRKLISHGGEIKLKEMKQTD